MNFHSSTHTIASHLVSNGLSLGIVGRLLEHRKPMTTQRCVHFAESPLRDAADVFAKELKT